MVFSVSPSVIVREVDATAVIPAVATPPAAIAGVFRWGPTNERILITSEDELASRFGKPFANTTWQNHETFFTAADFLSYSNALYVTRVVSDSAAAATSTYFSAKHAGALGNSLEVAVVSSASFSDTLAAIGDATGIFTFNSNTVNLSLEDEITTALQVDDIVRIGNPTIGYQDLVVTEFTDDEANTSPFTYTVEFKNRYTLTEQDMASLSLERRWGYGDRVGAAPSNNTLVHISVIDKLGTISGIVGSVLELYENVSVSSSAKLPDGTTNYYVDVIANRSAYIKAIGTDAALGDNTPSAALTGTFTSPIYGALSGGSDGDGEAAIPLGKIALGYDLYKDPNEVDISALLTGKSSSSNLANYLTQNIAESRKDCVVYASPTYANVVTPANPTDKMNNAIAFRNSCTSSSYLVIDTGYKYRYDKYNDAYRWVPLNGDIAGLAARIEPWESPAGYKRGVIKNVVKLAFNPNKSQRDQLYGSDINPVISQVGQGVLLFGDKTALGTATGSAFTRINVRRLFITVEKAIATVAASFLFDFNDEFTQTQFKNLVEPFLRDIQGRRGIIDFRVVSDATVNTPDVIDRNIFRGNIFIKPARSINVIELTFVATRTGVEFDEIVGQPL
jgi:phage tail sheath protein FI